MTHTAFDPLRRLLPDFQHVYVDYSAADSPEEILERTEAAARTLMFAAAEASKGSASRAPLLIGGWSLGGLLALRLAAKGLADGLVLFAATARFIRTKEQTDLGWAEPYVKAMIMKLTKDREAVETKFRQMMFTEAEQDAGLSAALPPIGSWTTPALIAGLEVLRRVECLSLLREIECPALLIHGTEDRICPYGAAGELFIQLPQAELLPLPGCGHAPFIGRELQLSEALRRWWHEQEIKRHSTSI
jgi:pimeloyl-[acyl-carrier protein] methyl ester esterase